MTKPLRLVERGGFWWSAWIDSRGHLRLFEQLGPSSKITLH